MKSGFRASFVLLLFIASTTCQQQNSTQSLNETDTKKQKPASKTPTEPPPFWCPVGYQLLSMQGKWVHACRPQSCAGTENTTTWKCTRITKTLRTCPKIHLSNDQFEFDGTGRLFDLEHNSTVKLGDFVIKSTGAIICNPSGNGTLPPLDQPSNATVLPRWCMPMVLPKDGYSKGSEGLFVPSINLHIKLFHIEQDETAHICPDIDPKITEKCGANMGSLPGHEFEVMPDWGIRHNKNILGGTTYSHGEYILAADRTFAIICIVPGRPRPAEVFYVYGAASLVSAFCLILAIVVHLVFPTLNYNANILLCLAFSFLVMYVAITVRFFSGHFESETANLVLFSVQYISSLGAFFWLSILSFDLWRVFTNLQITMNPGGTVLQKRLFVAKCAYAWGIPTVLCVLIVALTYNINAQRSLGLDLQLLSSNWFHDMKTILVMFYIPIIIVLLENIAFFTMTIVNLRKASRQTSVSNSKVSRKLFRVYLKLFLVMGLSWLFEIISWLAKGDTGEEVWYVTDVINCLQGVFIFLVYVFKKKTLKIIKHKLGYINSSQVDTTTSMSEDGATRMNAIALDNIHRNDPMEPGETMVEARMLLSNQESIK